MNIFRKIIGVTISLIILCNSVIAFADTSASNNVFYYNGHTYKVYDKSMDWSTAKAYCEKLGGHLATISSKEENDFVFSLIKERTKSIYWLGATCNTPDKKWQWVTGEVWNYKNWSSGNPDHYHHYEGYEEYLGILRVNSGNSGYASQWNDFINAKIIWGGETTAFVCEWDNTNVSISDYSTNLNIQFDGIKDIIYNSTNKTYDTEKFAIIVNIQRNVSIESLNYNDIYDLYSNITITLPDGFSFSQTETIQSKSFSMTINEHLSRFGVYVYLKKPTIGTHTINVNISGDEIIPRNFSTNIYINEESFNAAIYKANWNINNKVSGLESAESLYFINTPSNILKEAGEQNGLRSLTTIWTGITKGMDIIDDPTSAIDYTFSLKDMYEVIIFDMFDSSVDGKMMGYVNNDIIKQSKGLQGLIMDILETDYNFENTKDAYTEISKMSDVELEAFSKKLSDGYKQKYNITDEDQDVFKAIKNILKYGKDVQSICENIAEYNNIHKLNKDMQCVLNDMYNRADNLFMKEALRECVTVMEASDEEFAQQMISYSVSFAGKDVAQYIFNKYWDNTKQKFFLTHPKIAILYETYKGSEFLSNELYGTTDLTDDYSKLVAISNVEDVARQVYYYRKQIFLNNRTEENAQTFNSATDVFFNLLNKDYEYSLDFAKDIDKSTVGNILSQMGYSNTNDFIDSVNKIQGYCANVRADVSTNWIDCGLIEDYPSIYPQYSQYSKSYREAVKKQKIACPVDVYIFDKDGKLMGSVINNNPYCIDDANLSIVVENSEKTVYTYDNEFIIVYRGTGLGNMNISINEFTQNTKSNYDDIPLDKNIIYFSPILSNISELKNFKNIQEEGEIILPNYSSEKDGIYHNIKIVNGFFCDEISNNKDLATSSDSDIVAYIPDNAIFTGWTSSCGTDIFEDCYSVKTSVHIPDDNTEIIANYSLLEDGFIVGDVNIDNEINLLDAIAILNKIDDENYILPIEEKNAGYMYYLDIDKDRKITQNDAALILKMIET